MRRVDGGNMLSFLWNINWWSYLIIGLYLCIPVGWLIGKYQAKAILKKEEDGKKNKSMNDNAG